MTQSVVCASRYNRPIFFFPKLISFSLTTGVACSSVPERTKRLSEAAVGLQNDRFDEEADWGACRYGWRMLDGGRQGGCGGSEYVPDIFCESADVEGISGKS